jgi:hypothetical protein
MICALLLIELDYPSATVQPNVLSEFRPGIKEVQGRGSLLDAVPLGSLKQSLKGEGKLIQGNPFLQNGGELTGGVRWTAPWRTVGRRSGLHGRAWFRTAPGSRDAGDRLGRRKRCWMHGVGGGLPGAGVMDYPGGLHHG